MSIDLYLFTVIHNQAKKSKILDSFAIFCADYLGYLLLVFLAVIGLITKDWRFFIVPLLSGLFSRFVVTQVVYMFYQRKRPVEVLAINALIKKPHHPSFPSGHTAFFFGLSFALFFFSAPLAVVFTGASCFIALARIFCGVHWPSDILGGIGSGFITWMAVVLLT